MKTLEDAKQWLRKQFGVGADCPCCGQHVKLYKRPLNASMAYVLILLSRVEATWTHVPSFIAEQTKDNPRRGAAVRGDWAKLRFWGLIEEMPNGERVDGSNRAGYYRITELGRKFVANEIRVPQYIYLYNEKIIREQRLREMGVDVDASTVNIDDVVARKFDYQEIMQPCL